MSTTVPVKSDPSIVNFQTTAMVRDACLCLHVQRAARVLARRFDRAFKPLGLTHGQFSLLMSLNRPEGAMAAAMGVPPATVGSVAELLGMDRTTVTAVAKTLTRRGLMTVVSDSGDRRERRMRLTATGMRLLAEAMPIWAREHGALKDAVKDPEGLRAGLAALLQE